MHRIWWRSSGDETTHCKTRRDITLNANEELGSQALIKLGQYPAGSIVLLDEEKAK